MGRKDPRVDAYIAGAAPFARPILTRLRRIVHAGCPGVEETLKWSMPHFEYKGILCSMAAFKAHCVFGFWKQSLVLKGDEPAGGNRQSAMGQFGRITALSDLPDEKKLIGYVRRAAELNDKGVRAPTRPRSAPNRALSIPEDFMKALREHPRAKTIFDGFSYTNRKEYVEWIAEARLEATRKRRLETAIAWLAEGRIRNWKYERK